MAAERQYQAPDGYVNEVTNLAEYQLGTEYLNETTETAAPGGLSIPVAMHHYHQQGMA